MSNQTHAVVRQARTELTPERLLRLTRAGPRYTSYPTVPQWRTDFSDEEVDAGLCEVEGPVSVYVHVPFCKEQCWFCGCNQVVSRRQSAGDRYLDALQVQIEGLKLSSRRVPAQRVHLGGGTPTWLDSFQLGRLFGLLRQRFDILPGAEISVEADPDVTSDEQVGELLDLGVNRLSLGVQSFDPVVLRAINRPQDGQRVHGIMARCQQAGLRGLNIDLIYGLPHQTRTRFGRTLDEVIAIRPDRLAIYSYAHVPWMRPHQRRIDADALPDPHGRMTLYLDALERLSGAGYIPIGMDHFALPGDELVVAQRSGQLHRNFMGYTTVAGSDLIGLGVSAISELGDLYAQQQTHLGAWYRAIETDAPITQRGIRLTEEDRQRREIIRRLMCDFALPMSLAERFPDALEALTALEADGLVTNDGDALTVMPIGRLLIRNIAMAFDGHLGDDKAARFSATV